MPSHSRIRSLLAAHVAISIDQISIGNYHVCRQDLITMSSTAPIPVSNILRSSNSDAAKQDLWEQAWNTLNTEDQKQYGDSTSGILDILKNVCNGSWIMRVYFDSAARNIQVKPADVRPLNKVQEATESKKKLCVAKGWRIYRNKHGEEVKLRHVLENPYGSKGLLRSLMWGFHWIRAATPLCLGQL